MRDLFIKMSVLGKAQLVDIVQKGKICFCVLFFCFSAASLSGKFTSDRSLSIRSFG